VAAITTRCALDAQRLRQLLMVPPVVMMSSTTMPVAALERHPRRR